MKYQISNTDVHALEARFAVRVANRLSLGLDGVPSDVSERLRFARDQAIARARETRLEAASGGTVTAVSARGAAMLSGFGFWGQRAASVLPLLVLVAGFMLIEQWSTREQVLVAADIDARLLADQLPPAAYSDPGFAEYLRTTPAP